MAYPPSSDFSHLPPLSPLQPCSSSEPSTEVSSDIDYDPCLRDLSLPPVHPPYQHYSNLRTTNKSKSSLETKLSAHSGPAHLDCYCEMSSLSIPPPSSTCDECVQECEEGECHLQLTEECTEQCVVVPCHDPHYGYPTCDANDGLPCDLDCEVDSTGCSALDNFIDCCTDYRQFFADMRPPNETPGTFGWPPIPESMNQGYTGQPASSDTGFYSASSSASTPQLMPGRSSLVPSPHPLPSAVPPPQQYAMSHSVPGSSSTRLPCMWGNCTASFSSLSELVGHVNLQHLRLPDSAGAMEMHHVDATSQMQSQHQQMDSSNPLSCLWADCQLYPTPNSIPGPSSGSQAGILGVLANHLLQDHLGLPTRSASTGAPSMAQNEVDLQQSPHPQPSSPQLDAGSTSPSSPGPLTPAPEHDCLAPHAHVCHWTQCGRSFASCDELTAHITSTHVGSGKAHYDCYWEDCSRHGDSGFASKQKICRHLQSHTGHRPFQCKVCQQNFSEAATLAQHMRRHTQEKPYVCDYPGCGKSFAITGALTIHKRIHNGDKPFKCTYCEKAFSESSNLSKHLRTHTGLRPYSCTEPGCKKTFARPDQLARHMTVHRKKEKLNETVVQAAVPLL